MKTLIIARHGNTFGPQDRPTRVGARTDLPLVEKGREQARALGEYLREHDLIPDLAYASSLLRQRETARIALEACGCAVAVQSLEMLREIDYGPVENQPEEAVIDRVGAEAIKRWDEEAIVPPGWRADPAAIIKGWISLAQDIEKSRENVFFAVTSNGIARFAPHITGDFEGFQSRHPLKLRTGAVGLLTFGGRKWAVSGWDIRP